MSSVIARNTSAVEVLLVRPINRTSMLIPNHGLGYIATALRNAQVSVAISDFIRDKVTAPQIMSHVAGYAPHVIGVQVYTFDLPGLKSQLSALKQAAPNALLVAGGPHPTADPNGVLRDFPEFDALFIGESELGFASFLEQLRNTDFRFEDILKENVPGLAYRINSEHFRCNPQPIVSDLDSLGFPAWDLIPPASYPLAPQGTFLRRIPYAPIIVTRGCPYQCTFCAGYLVSGRNLRSRSVDHVMEELSYLVTHHHIKEFHIQDDNFTFHREYVLQFCDSLLRRNLNLSWACPNGVRLDSLDSEVLRMMERAGCYSIAVGIESGTQRVLNLMKKRLDIAEVRQRIALIRSSTRMHVTGFFILGYPGETFTEMQSTVKLALSLDIDKVNFGILMPLPGTEVHQLLKKKHLLDDFDLSRMSEYRSSFTPEGITPQEFRHFFRKSFIQFYARPRIILRFLRDIKSIDQIRVLFHRLRDVIAM